MRDQPFGQSFAVETKRDTNVARARDDRLNVCVRYRKKLLFAVSILLLLLRSLYACSAHLLDSSLAGRQLPTI